MPRGRPKKVVPMIAGSIPVPVTINREMLKQAQAALRELRPYVPSSGEDAENYERLRKFLAHVETTLPPEETVKKNPFRNTRRSY